jgi:SAM-dependent methyltransferase
VLPPLFGDCVEEVRLDLNPDTNPDIVGGIQDLGDIGVFDACYCSHVLEHLYPHEVGMALREIRRVLTEDGFALIFVPDLEGVTISDEVLFHAPGGPISAIDMIYGFRPQLEKNPAMAHHTGFTSDLLETALREAGFREVTMQRMECYNLMAVAQG